MVNSITIKTNHRARHTLDWHELTAKERKKFDYLDSDEKQIGATFVRYRGWTYDLGEFTRVPAEMFQGKWDGYSSDSFFSGVLIKYVDDGWGDLADVVMATYYS
jgi:hypothetical protein